MNQKPQKQPLKALAMVLVTLTISFLSKAQNTTVAVDNIGLIRNADVAAEPVASGTVRLIDNKGTIKYLQVKNGITAITNTASNSRGITTTWQLGGELTDDTYIDVNGRAFVIDRIKLLTAEDDPSIDASTESIHGGSAKGWTVLVRDEASGETKKILASDLLQVQSGQNIESIEGTTYSYTIAQNAPKSIQKISVYRNGAKLIPTTDYSYTYTAATASGVVALNPASTDHEEWALNTGDVIEIQWVK